MNAKNVNLLEQHVEKIILGVGALVAIVITFLYILGEPYSVDLGGKETAPAEVKARVNRPLEDLRRALDSQNTPKELDIPVATHARWFNERQASSLAGGQPLPVPLGGSQGLDMGLLNAERQAQDRYVLPSLPGPDEVQARADFAVLLEDEALEEIFAEPDFISAALEDADHSRLGQAVADRFARYVAVETPRDFEFVSVMGRFDWDQWQKALEEATGPGGVPVEWWKNRTIMVDVILERQEQNAATETWGAMRDGQWEPGAVDLVEPLPGALTFRQRPADVNPRELKSLVAMPQVQEQILQPIFAPVEGDWLRPDEQPKERTAKEENRLMSINRQINDMERHQQDLANKAASEAVKSRQREEAMRLRQDRDRRTDKVGRDNDNSRRTSRDTSRTAAGTRGLGQSSTAMPKTAAQRLAESQAELAVKLDKLYLERDVLMGRIEEEEVQAMEQRQRTAKQDARSGRNAATRGRPGALPGAAIPGGSRPGVGYPGAGYPMGGMMGPGGMMGAPGMMNPYAGGPGMAGNMRLGSRFQRGAGARYRQRSYRQRSTDAREPDEVDELSTKVTVWGHDITVLPGHVYRYRLRVAVYNPLFQKHDRLVDELDAVADELGWESEPSGWGQAIAIHPKAYFFVVRGSQRVAEGTVEIYRIFNGGWRREEFTVHPGDTIGGTRRLESDSVEREIDLSVGALVVDIDPDAQSQQRATRQTVKLIYLDIDTGELIERTAEQDRDDPMRVYLHNKTMMEEKIDDLARAEGR